MHRQSLPLFLSCLLLAGLCACADGRSKKERPCGNGVLDPGEQCDDHNGLAEDGCSPVCEFEEGWECTDAIPTVCAPVCGDGRVVGLEPCDDGAQAPGDGCDGSCAVEPGWTCENMPSVCVTTCGDGVPAGDEACDDGAQAPGDGCDGACRVEPGWSCDDASPSACGAAACGDGIAAGDEACDGWDLPGQDCLSLGFDAGTLLCATDCTFDTSECQRCGDGVCGGGELCAQDCGATYLSVGFAHACVLMATDRAYCWGYNHAGQLGNARVGAQGCLFGIPCDPSPQEVLGIDDMVVIHAGFSTTCGIRSQGMLQCWGSNHYGQLGDNRADHGILCDTVDCSLVPVTVQLPLPMTAAAVESGYYHTCALSHLGTVACWGSNEYGELGDGLSSHGTTCASNDCSRLPVQVSGLDSVLMISAGAQFTCALRSNGTVWCWGNNDNGELGDGTVTSRNVPVRVSGLTDVAQISAGSGNFACAVRGDNTVWCWGINTDGQLGDGTAVERRTPVRVGTLLATSVSCGSNHVCARKADLSTWCWGGNSGGQLGTGSTVPSPAPIQLALPLEAGSVIAGGWYFTCAHSTLSGAVGCWGNNGLGQLGQGSLTESLVPVLVPGLEP